jgi:predicted nucleic acid-binding protein
VIYIDSSVALARLFFEARSPAPIFWTEPMVSSRLLEYEVWNRVHAYGRTDSHAAEAATLLTGVELIDMERPVLARALQPLPRPLRTLDALHLATMHHLRASGESVELASYDSRLVAAAQALGIAIAPL